MHSARQDLSGRKRVVEQVSFRYAVTEQKGHKPFRRLTSSNVVNRPSRKPRSERSFCAASWSRYIASNSSRDDSVAWWVRSSTEITSPALPPYSVASESRILLASSSSSI